MFEMYIEATVRGYQLHILMMHLFGLVKYWHAIWSSTILTTNMLWRSKTKMETWLDMYQRNYPGSFISFLMILENLRQNELK